MRRVEKSFFSVICNEDRAFRTSDTEEEELSSMNRRSYSSDSIMRVNGERRRGEQTKENGEKENVDLDNTSMWDPTFLCYID